MGYAGYAPTKFPPAKPTEIEAALAAIKSLEALEIIGKLVYNAAVQARRRSPRPCCMRPPRAASALPRSVNTAWG